MRLLTVSAPGEAAEWRASAAAPDLGPALATRKSRTPAFPAPRCLNRSRKSWAVRPERVRFAAAFRRTCGERATFATGLPGRAVLVVEQWRREHLPHVHFYMMRKHADQEVGSDPTLEAADWADLEVGRLYHPSPVFAKAGDGNIISQLRYRRYCGYSLQCVGLSPEAVHSTARRRDETSKLRSAILRKFPLPADAVKVEGRPEFMDEFVCEFQAPASPHECSRHTRLS